MDWDAEPDMPVANNQADLWDVDDAAAVPLLAHDDDPFAFGAAVAPIEKNKTFVTAVEVPADTPATTPDDAGGDWAVADDFAPAPAPSTAPDVTNDDWLTGAPSASVDANADPFGRGGVNADPFSGPAQNDPFSMEPPAIPKKKRVVRPDLIPEKSKNFADFFIAELSEYYEAPEPGDVREFPLRRQETHNIYARELAISSAAGVENSQQDNEKKAKRSHIHYNGSRVTTNHTWTDFETRLLLCMMIRNVHQHGKPDPTDRMSKRTRMEQRRQLNASLPEATDGHVHRGQWAYHDVAEILNKELDHDIPVVDVRDMVHRLVDERKGAVRVANRIHAPRMTKIMAMVWKRKQNFVGSLEEWEGDEEYEGRKAREEKQAQNAAGLEFNTGDVGGISSAPNISGVQTGWTEGATNDGSYGDAFGGAIVDYPFGTLASAPAAGGGSDWGDEAAPSAPIPAVGSDSEWGVDETAVATDLFTATEAIPASASASQPNASRLGEFSLDDPFSAPLPAGNTATLSDAPAASTPWDEAPPAPVADDGLDDWVAGDDSVPAVVRSAYTDSVMSAAPSTFSPNVVEPTNTNFGNNLPTSTFVMRQDAPAPATFFLESAVEAEGLAPTKKVNNADDAGDVWGDDDDASSSPQATALAFGGSSIPGGTAENFLDSMTANTNITNTTRTPNSSYHSQTRLGYQSQGFTAVNAVTKSTSSFDFGTNPSGDRAMTNVLPPSAPQANYTIDPSTGLNPERLALLAAAREGREYTPPAEERDPQGSWGSQNHMKGRTGGGVSSFNAIPLAFNRFTGQRADSAADGRTPLAAANGNGTRGGGDASTPLPGWGDSPTSAGDGSDNWDAPDASATQTNDEGGHGVVGGNLVAQKNAQKERRYVDLDAGNSEGDDVELDY